MTQIFEHIDPLARSLDYHVERHNLIASNIANVDTPGYRPRELAFEDELAMQTTPAVRMVTTRSGHLNAAGEAQDEGIEAYEETWAAPGADGNYVRLEHEMSRLQANSLRYQASTQMINRHLGLLRYSITGR